ncbi:MAG: energy transducer TonB [Burkholderiales bacterium]|nr:energy transducer TonB [Burkholderiales bacterium]
MAAALATPRSERDRWLAALAIALLLELALLAGLLWWSTHRVVPVPPAPVDIVLAPSPAPTVQAPPAPPAPKPPPPKVVEPPRPHPPVHAAPRPMPTPAPPPPPAPTPTAVAAPPPAPDTRPAMPVAAAPPAPPPPAPAATDTGARRAAFEAQLRAAVQAAVHYPAAAKLMRLHGKTLVAFDYQDRRVGQVRVAQSSGSAELDRAAQAAVQGAEFPPPPAELAGRTLHFDVWVRFFLQDEAD